MIIILWHIFGKFIFIKNFMWKIIITYYYSHFYRNVRQGIEKPNYVAKSINSKTDILILRIKSYFLKSICMKLPWTSLLTSFSFNLLCEITMLKEIIYIAYLTLAILKITSCIIILMVMLVLTSGNWLHSHIRSSLKNKELLLMREENRWGINHSLKN